MRKPAEIVPFKLRLRERLRAKLEAAASRNRTSINNEIARRLERSFEAESERTIDDVAEDIKNSWLSWRGALLSLNRQGDLVVAVELLLKQLDHKRSKDKKLDANQHFALLLEDLIANVREAIVAIDKGAKRITRVGLPGRDEITFPNPTLDAEDFERAGRAVVTAINTLAKKAGGEDE